MPGQRGESSDPLHPSPDHVTGLTGSTTLHKTTAEVRSDIGGGWSSMVRKQIESYGVGKFEVNSEIVSFPWDGEDRPRR